MPSPDSRSTMASLRNSSVSPSSAWNQFAPGTPERSNTTGSSATTIPPVSCMTATAIADRERAVLATALSQPVRGSAILVADHPSRGVVGGSLLESRRDYFTKEAHGHVAIPAVARGGEGQGIGRALLQAGEDWARANRYSKLTLAVFKDNERAKQVYERQGWRSELETWYKPLV